jgi:hypothetical protein
MAKRRRRWPVRLWKALGIASILRRSRECVAWVMPSEHSVSVWVRGSDKYTAAQARRLAQALWDAADEAERGKRKK